ncbi:PIG-L family deacetylase [Georgenia sp. SYP-B2076]|uniref:PIG-L family deacetylase n=1 Tax=Georgenia sp. SYP-B2076 TaxID=2495881 RepID=UPI0013DEBC54|nr:PIG-L family deacetylase [Georgenia sp. SYP-B2076]
MTSTRGIAPEILTGGLVGVFAHPDDEVLGAGGLLATAVRAGVGVTVVTATRGERGDVIPGDLAHLKGNGPALAHERQHELTRALTALGVHSHFFLDSLPGLAGRRPPRFTGSGMVWQRPGVGEPEPDAGPSAFAGVPVELSARLLAGLLRRARPQVVVTEEPNGAYGHPDHVQTHRVTMRAVELAAEASEMADDDPLVGLEPYRVPVVAWVVESETRYRSALRWLQEVHRHRPVFGALGQALAPIPADGAMPSMVFPDDQVDLVIDISHALPAVAAALRAHRSQVQSVHLADLTEPEERAQPALGWFALSNGLLLPLLGTACLHLVPGYDDVDRLAVEPIHHRYNDPIPVAERYGLAGIVGLAGLDVRDRLGRTAGRERLAAFLGADVAR